jgi:putative sterol carrier protein
MEQTAGFASLRENVSTREFSRLVKTASDAELEAALHGPRRERILDQIFSRMPSRLRADRAHGIDTVIHWRIGGSPAGGEDVYEVTIHDGTCEVARPPNQEPDVTFAIEAVPFIKLIAGATSPFKIMVSRQLRITGDLPLAMRVGRLFGSG